MLCVVVIFGRHTTPPEIDSTTSFHGLKRWHQKIESVYTNAVFATQKSLWTNQSGFLFFIFVALLLTKCLHLSFHVASWLHNIEKLIQWL